MATAENRPCGASTKTQCSCLLIDADEARFDQRSPQFSDFARLAHLGLCAGQLWASTRYATIRAVVNRLIHTHSCAVRKESTNPDRVIQHYFVGDSLADHAKTHRFRTQSCGCRLRIETTGSLMRVGNSILIS